MPECGAATPGEVMARDHYHGFSHPVLVDLPATPPCDLLSEMDIVADELRTNQEHVEGDDQIAFRQLLRLRGFDLTRAQFLDLYGLWREFYRARCEARLAVLCKEREELFAERAVAPPQQHAALTARLLEIGCELAELNTPSFPAAPLGDWV